MGNAFAKMAHLASMPMVVGEEALATTPWRSACVVQQVTSPSAQPATVHPPALRPGGRTGKGAVAGPDIGTTHPLPDQAWRQWAGLAPAETGCPETTAEFVRCMKDHFVVRNHNSVGVKRPYLNELSFDHLHYGVA